MSLVKSTGILSMVRPLKIPQGMTNDMDSGFWTQHMSRLLCKYFTSTSFKIMTTQSQETNQFGK